MDELRQEAILKTEARMLAKDAKAAPKAEEPIDKTSPQAEITEQPEIPVESAAPVDDDDHDSEEDDNEDSADSDGDEAAAPKRKQSRREQRRFNKLTREKYEALRERDAAILQAQMLAQQYQQQAPQTPQRVQQQASAGEPTLEQFGYDTEAFQKAERQWLIQEAKRAARQEIEQEFTQRQMQEQGTRFQQRVAELEKKMPGAWQRATQAPLQTTPIMEQVVFNSEHGPEIGVYLADHLDEAQAISRLPPMQQAVALGRIEAAVKAQPIAPPRPPTAVSRAPAPPAPLPSGASSVVKSADKMTIEDHMAVVRAKRQAKFG